MLTTYRFRQKFKSFIDQYEYRELHFQSLMRTKECEVQYNIARYEQQRKLAENETTRSRTLSAQVSTFSHTETELRSQLNIYVEKFKQVRVLFISFMPVRVFHIIVRHVHENLCCLIEREFFPGCFLLHLSAW